MKKLLLLLLAAGLLTACGNDEVKTEEEPKAVDQSKDSADAVKEEPVEEKKDDVSREYKNALKSAQNYLNVMPFSEKGLLRQLTSEAGDKYPEDAAQYAIDNVEVDYNEQALKAAENYQSVMPMSDQELLNQLTSDAGDQYTQEQAQYAIDNLPE